MKTDQVVLICFKQEVVKAFKQALPKNMAYWLSSFKKDKEGVWKPSLETVLATLKDNKADGLDSHKNVPVEIAKKIMKEGYEWLACIGGVGYCTQ